MLKKNLITQKYGKGKTNLRKGETCDYEKVIQSAGIHVSESGAIKVYADDDKFSCPKCDGNKGNLDEVPECKGSLHLIVRNLFAFEIEAIYHEKHRIKFAVKVSSGENIVIFALILISGLDKSKEAENDNTNDHSTVCNG